MSEEPTSAHQSRWPKLRFSVGGLLITTTLLALVSAFIVATPHWLASSIFFFLIAAGTSAVAGAAVVLRSEKQAFCLGALVLLLSWRMGTSGSGIGFQNPGLDLLIGLGSMAIVAALCGGVAMLTARWLLRRELSSDSHEEE